MGRDGNMRGIDATRNEHSPQPQSPASLRGCLIKGGATALGILVLCALCSAWFVPYAQYKSSHDIPNPFWGVFGKTVTYTPEQGPPSPELLDSRPEAVVLAYIADYQKLAGTYPCTQDLASYNDGNDPVLLGQPCSVHRPIVSVIVRSVRVGAVASSPGGIGPFEPPQADVHLDITYADGIQYAMTISMLPSRYQKYWFTYLHMDCWGSSGITAMYPKLVSHVPRGVNYYGYDAQGNPLCQR